jgi:hypothetical protein
MRSPIFAVVTFLCILGPATQDSLGADSVQPDPERRRIATYVSETGTLLRRENPRQPWELVAARKRLYSGDILVSAGDAEVASDNGAVRLLLRGNIGGTTPLPILETAVKLQPAAGSDLDFTFLRGRVDLVNRKAEGVATVRVRGPERAVEVRLLEPGTRVALVAYGRWLPGASFRSAPKAGEHRPALVFAALVLHGEVELQTATHQFVMRAPPGPALLEGDQIGDSDPSPRWLDMLPDWAVEKAGSDTIQNVNAALDRFRDRAQRQSVPEALDQLLLSDDGVERKVALALLGATDDLPRLANLLATPQSPASWEDAVLILRHWIGREPGQDERLHRALVAKKRLTPIQAETVLQLLHSFSDDELTQPETYEALIDLMGSDQLAIRGLAHWHLYRLVPAGRKIGFDLLASPEKRAQTVQEWRKLVPAGKLPPYKSS